MKICYLATIVVLLKGIITLGAQNVGPRIFTQELLGKSGDTFEEMVATFKRIAASQECLNIEVINYTNLSIVPIEFAIREGFESVFIHSASYTGAGHLNIYSEEDGNVSQKKNFVPSSIFRDRSINLENLFNRELPGEQYSVHIVILNDSMSKSAAVCSQGGDIYMLLGEDIIAEPMPSYISHCVANLLGLRPLWNLEHPCAEGQLEGVPHHSSANYDCGKWHRSGCRGTPELQANIMDARWCNLEFSWTVEQVDYLKEQLGQFTFGMCEGGERTKRKVSKLEVSPSVISKSGTGEVTIKAMLVPGKNYIVELVNIIGNRTEIAVIEANNRRSLPEEWVKTIYMGNYPPGSYVFSLSSGSQGPILTDRVIIQ